MNDFHTILLDYVKKNNLPDYIAKDISTLTIKYFSNLSKKNNESEYKYSIFQKNKNIYENKSHHLPVVEFWFKHKSYKTFESAQMALNHFKNNKMLMSRYEYKILPYIDFHLYIEEKVDNI
jgi:hypothetical protein